MLLQSFIFLVRSSINVDYVFFSKSIKRQKNYFHSDIREHIVASGVLFIMYTNEK